MFIAVGASILAALSWSIAALLYKIGLKSFNVLLANLIRLTSATAFLSLLLTFLYGLNWLRVMSYPVIFYMIANVTAALGIGDLCYFISINKIGVSRAVPIAYSFPLFLYPLAILLLGEETELYSLIASVLVVLGIYLVSQGGEQGMSRTDLTGILPAICTAFSWALSIIFLKLALQHAETLALNAGRMLIILPIMFLAVIASASHKQVSPHKAKSRLISLVLAGIIALGIGDTLLIYALSLASATIVAPLSATSPLFSAILAMAFLREKVTSKLALGAMLITIGAGILLSQV